MIIVYYFKRLRIYFSANLMYVLMYFSKNKKNIVYGTYQDVRT